MNITTKEHDLRIELACNNNRKNLILLGYIKTLFKQNELEEDWMIAKEISACTDLHGDLTCNPQFVGALLGKLNIKSKTIDGYKKWNMLHLRNLVESASLVLCSKEDFRAKIKCDKAEFFGLSNKGKSIKAGYVTSSSSYLYIPYPNVLHFNAHHDIFWKRWYKCTYSTVINVLNEELPKYSKYNEKSGCIEWTGEANPKGYALLSQSKAEGLPTRYVHRLKKMVAHPTTNLGMLKNNNDIEYEVHHACENACCITDSHLQIIRKDLHEDLHATSPVAHYHVKEKAPEEPAVLSNSVKSLTSNGAVEPPKSIAPKETFKDKIGYSWTPNYDIDVYGHDEMLTPENIPNADPKDYYLSFTTDGEKLYSQNSSIQVTHQRILDDGNLYVELNDYPLIADPSFTRIYKEGVLQ
jgi:hypothetical protein